MIVNKNNISFSVKENQIENDKSFWDRINNNIWEEHTFNYLDKYLSVDKNFIDIGAWIGPISLYSSFKCKRCFSFEPDPLAFSSLSENVKINNIDNIELFNLAIGDKDGIIPLGIKGKRGDSMSSILSENNPDNVMVEIKKLSDIVKDMTDVSVVKIDIEGYESVIIDEIIKSLGILKFPVLIISLHKEFFKNPESDIDNILIKLGNFYKNENGLDIDISDIRKYNFVDLCLIPK